MSSILVIGAGYVGLATAACFAHLGHDVVAAEIDDVRLAQLQAGEPPFMEHGMSELLAEGIANGRLGFTHPKTARYEAADFVFLCVPTPQGPDGGADLSAVEAAVELAGPRLRPGAIVVNKSTVPVGTTRRIASLLGRADVAVVANPEFLQEGAAITAFLNAERIVVGAVDERAGRAVASLYATTSPRVHFTSFESAELAKHACNAFLATKLSFVNALIPLCEETGADLSEVTMVMGSDRRIAAEFLRPGPGWGGSCFPKDTRALVASAELVGVELPLVTAVIESNNRAFDHVVARLEALCGGTLRNKRVGVWGLAFKAGTDDARDSPALAVIERLRAHGAAVRAYDPAVVRDHGVTVVASHYDAAEGAHAVVVLTEWPQFAAADFARVARVMATPVLLDTRGVIDTARARAAGLECHTLGRRTSDADAP